MKRQDLEVLSEFLVMAATLIDIKSRMLLPSNPDSEEEEEDPRAELVQQLLEYKMYKCMAYELKDRQMDAGRVMYKKPTIPEEVRAYEPPVDIHELMSDITLSRLHEIFESIMKKQQDKIDPLRSKFGKIEKEEVSLEDKTEGNVTDHQRMKRDNVEVIDQEENDSFEKEHSMLKEIAVFGLIVLIVAAAVLIFGNVYMKYFLLS